MLATSLSSATGLAFLGIWPSAALSSLGLTKCCCNIREEMTAVSFTALSTIRLADMHTVLVMVGTNQSAAKASFV